MLDLDKFKEVNDSLGHHVGDQLLVQVGARLRENLRDGDLLARLGGDEFAILLDDAGQAEAVNAATRLCAAVDEPFLVDGVSLHSGVSIGIALFPDDGSDLSQLLRKADIAMYRAKNLSTGHHVYCIADDADDAARLLMGDARRITMTADHLVVPSQPTIQPVTSEVHSVEALVP
jgi:diguanylate cyclase (GGDEF)-like protein